MTTRLTHCLAAAAMAVLFAGPAWTAMPILEESAEVERLDAQVDSSGVGTVTVRRCDQCDAETLNITAATRLYLNREPVPLARIRDHLDASATVIFKPDSPEVIRIRLSRAPAAE